MRRFQSHTGQLGTAVWASAERRVKGSITDADAHNTFGASSESGKKLLDQLELQLAELEEGMAEDKATAAIASGLS